MSLHKKTIRNLSFRKRSLACLSQYIPVLLVLLAGGWWGTGFMAAAGKAPKEDDEKLFRITLEELLEMEIDVSSTRAEKVLHTPSTVTVVDREMIERYHFLSLAEALESVAGIEVYQTIIDKNVTTSRGVLQNFYANKILLMINNVPTWQPIYGDGHLERIDIQDVERIEILKGPASVLYGSNAYSGVINIVLKERKTTWVSAYGRAGARNLGGSGVNVHYNKSRLNLFISAGTHQEERKPYLFQAASPFPYNGALDFQHYEEYNRRNFNFRLNYKGHTLYLNNFYFQHTYLGAHPSYLGGAGTHVKNRGTLFNYRLDKHIGENIFLRGDLFYDYFERDFPLSADRVQMISIAGDRMAAQLKLNYDHSEHWGLELGGMIENRGSRGHDTVNGMDGSLIRHNLKEDENILEWSLFAQVGYKTKAFNLLVGTRYTGNRYFGDNVSSRVTGVIKLNKRSSIKVIWGQSFRVPTMFELYFDHPTVMGNRQLKPELSTSYELAYLVGGKRLFFQVLGYYGIYKNLIQRITLPTGPPSHYRNASLLKGYGAEVELRYQNPSLVNGFLNYNFIKGVDDETDNNYRFVPGHTFYFGLNKTFGRLFISSNGKLVSTAHGHLEDIKPQFRLDAHIGYTHTFYKIKLRHTLSVKNITASEMWIPEYIRKTPNINALPTAGFGRRLVYSVFVNF
jgi:outer membrane receptor protein involved in Fe transport